MLLANELDRGKHRDEFYGLQLLDDDGLTEHVRKSLGEFIKMLCTAASIMDKVVKVLFTTDGFSRELVGVANSVALYRETYEDEEEDEGLSLTVADLPIF